MIIVRKSNSVLILLILFIVSCSGKPAVKPSETFDTEKAFATANEQLEKKDYEKARAAFIEIKNRDTSKKFAPLAQLRIADSYAKGDEPEIAVTEYRKFLEAYPDLHCLKRFLSSDFSIS